MADSRLKGYECKFVKSVKDDHQCTICLLPIREPVQISECGHVFCKSCLDSWSSACSASVAKCPIDNQTPILGNTFFDRRLDREIKSLKVYCENHASGCKEQIELREYDEHRQNCPLRLVKCDNCHVSFFSKELERHLAKCPDYETHCLFAPIGCSNKMKRRFLKRHHEESTRKHLSQLTLAAFKLYTEGDSVPEKEPNVTYELPVSLKDKFAKIAKKGESVEHLDSEPADSSQEESSKALKQSIKLLKKDNEKLQKEVSEFTQEIVELKEKMNKLIQEIEVMREDEDLDSLASEVPTFEPFPGAIGAAFFLYCPYTWRVDMAKCMGLNTFFSPSFYSRQRGYKFGMSLKYSGSEGGKHKWSFRCFLKKGDYDSQLPWPFTGIVNFHVERVDPKKVLSNYICNHTSNKGRTGNLRKSSLFYQYVEISVEDMSTRLVVQATLKLA